jgi:hypothetical protein
VWLVLYRVKQDDADSLAIQGELSTRYAAVREKKLSGVTIIEYDAK